MSRFDYYKEYYSVTDRFFCDKTFCDAEERKKAYQKGQGKTSKFERKFFIVCQYALLALCLVELFFFMNLLLAVFAILLSFLLFFITDFSFFRMEYFYRVCNGGSIYGKTLYKIFKQEFYDSILYLRKHTVNRICFVERGFGIYKSVNNCNIKIHFKFDRVILKTHFKRHTVKSEFATEQDLLNELINCINYYSRVIL